MTQSPKIVKLDLLDTDYAQMVEAEPVPDAMKQRLAAEDYDVDYISKQARRYRYAASQAARDDLLCKVATKAGLFTLADMEAIDDRIRDTGQFYLEAAERTQVINWLSDELAIQI